MRMTRRNMILGGFGASLFGRRSEASVNGHGGPAFGSYWRVALPDNVDVAPISQAIDAIISEIDRQMSPYLPNSDLTSFNLSESLGPHAMPEALCHVAAEAIRVAEMTGGYFDPTVGPLVARLGFGPITGQTGNFRDIGVGDEELEKRVPGTTLDLCGIAKGHALDRIIVTLAARGIGSALVELGGEVRAIGKHPEGRPWVVAIQDPRVPWPAAARIVDTRGMALATSGHAVHGVKGRVSSTHIIAPDTGSPAAQTLASVSVLAPSAMRADALATALCAAGAVEGPALARRLGTAALFLLDEPAGPDEVATEGFLRHVIV